MLEKLHIWVSRLLISCGNPVQVAFICYFYYFITIKHCYLISSYGVLITLLLHHHLRSYPISEHLGCNLEELPISPELDFMSLPYLTNETLAYLYFSNRW